MKSPRQILKDENEAIKVRNNWILILALPYLVAWLVILSYWYRDELDAITPLEQLYGALVVLSGFVVYWAFKRIVL